MPAERSQPRTSVIMNCLNSAEYLRESIDSVYAQTCGDWEIIFWDNASTDESAAIAHSYDGKLRYFRSPETVSLGKARNWAIEQAKGEFIAFLDCDDIWMPEKLEKQIKLFDLNPALGLVYSDTVFFNHRGDERQIYLKSKPPRGMIFKDLLANYFLSMETVVLRTKALRGLPERFDERLSMNEEADLFIRIAYGWEADYIDEPLAKWRVHAGSFTWKKQELFAIESQMMLDKYLKIFPGFEEEYKDEVESFRIKIAKQKFVNGWKRGDLRLRSSLRPYLTKDSRSLALYMISFLPYRFADAFLGYYRQRSGYVQP
ncbi:MAG: glycosyltransferase family 2 protein [Deltaproteobacteria bacterium]|nr:glycosyltransferase family 2 protein [Deltaproteobacteria bacterium]